MAKVESGQLLVGLDIGSHTVKAVIGEVLEDQQISILGMANKPVHGMDKGGVNDLNLVATSVKDTINELELMADCKVSSVLMSISGRHIACQNEEGMVPINHQEVTQDDVDQVIHAARSVPMAAERRLLHVLPQEYQIDVQEGIKNPLGMSGVRMEAQVHLITCADDMAKNLNKCAQRCELQADEFVFSALAASHAVLSQDEKELGVCLVDVGGGTIDLVIFTHGVVRYSAVIPLAGNQITNDIAKLFRTPISHAEEIKVHHACAMKQMASNEETIQVASVGGRPARAMSRQTLAEVVEPRLQELFELIHDQIVKSGLVDEIAAGVVMTGGTAKMEGAMEFAEEIFGMPARVGYPIGIKGLIDYVQDPSFAVAVGLLNYGQQQLDTSFREIAAEASIFQRMKSWFKGEF